MVKKLTPYRRAPELASASSIEEALKKRSMKELKNLRKAINWQIRKLNEDENNLSQSYKEYYNLESIVKKIKTGKEACNWNILIKYGMCIKSIQQIQHDLIKKIKFSKNKTKEFSNIDLNPNEISIENLTKLQNMIKNIIKEREEELERVESEIEERKKIQEANTKSTRQAINSGKYVNFNNLELLYKNNKKVFGD